VANRRISDLPEIAGSELAEEDLFTVVHVFEVDPALKNKKLTVAGTKQYFDLYYFPRTGGIISGNASVSGDFTVDKLTTTSGLIVTNQATVSGLIVQNSATVSGTISGITITGGTIQGSNINGTTVTATTVNATSGNFTNFVFNNSLISVALGSAPSPSISFSGDSNTGIYSPGADQLAISTNGTGRITVDTAAITSTLPIVHPLGTVGTPSITFTGDLNTGFWNPAGDTLAVSTGGNERARIDSSGRLLVGTSTDFDSYLNQVSSTSGSLLSLRRTNSNPGYIKLSSGASGDNVGNNGLLGYLRWYGFHTSTDYEAARISAEVDGTPGANDMPGRLVFSTTADGAANPTERMRIDSSGRLLVNISGTAGFPAGSQHIFRDGGGPTYSSVSISNVGGASDRTDLNITAWQGGGDNYYTSKLRTVGPDGSLAFHTQDTASVNGAGTSTEKMRITSTGNVGIGVTPTSFLHTNAPANATNNYKYHYLTSNQDLGGSASDRQYGLYISQYGARYTPQTALYAEPAIVFGGNYTGVHGKSGGGTDAGNSSEGVYGVTSVPDWNYGGRHCGVRGVAEGGTTSFVNAYGLTAYLGAFGGHFVAYGKGNCCGVYADAYQTASPGSGTIAVPLLVASNEVEKLRVTSDGYLRMAASTGGIQFNGDTAATNALDDYEEGTWTPTIAGITTAGTATYSIQTGTYTKIGRMVHVWCEVAWTSGTGTGNLKVTGLPFSSSSSSLGAWSIGYIADLTLPANASIAILNAANETNLFPQTISTVGGSTTMAALAYDAAARFQIAGTYIV
jgi:hypothetical protein